MGKNSLKILYIIAFTICAVVSIVNFYLVTSQYSVILSLGTVLFFAYISYLFIRRLWSPYGDMSKHQSPIFIEKSERPVGGAIRLFKSSYYDRYESVYKPIEIFSENDELIAVLGSKYQRTHNQKSINMLIDREIIKYNAHTHLKSFTGLLIPVLSVINLAIVFVRNIGEYRLNWGSLIADFFIPFIFLCAFIGVLLLWNKYHTHLEHSIDKALTTYYSVDDVCDFIEEIEKEEGGYEKEKYIGFNRMHMLKRVNKLKRMNRED